MLGKGIESRGFHSSQEFWLGEDTLYVTLAMQGTRLRRGHPALKKDKWKLLMNL